jgi:hypothetical protein
MVFEDGNIYLVKTNLMVQIMIKSGPHDVDLRGTQSLP